MRALHIMVLSLLLCISLLSSATVLTVTSTANSGAGTLRNQIAAATSGDTIDFNLSFPTSIFTTSPISITSNVTILGPGKSQLIVGSTGVIFLANGVNARFDSLTFSAPNIEAISGSGNIDISYCRFVNGQVIRYNGGGTLNIQYCEGDLVCSGTQPGINVVDNAFNSIVNITNSGFRANSGPILHSGSFGTITCTSSTFSGVGQPTLLFYRGRNLNIFNCTVFNPSGSAMVCHALSGPVITSLVFHNSILYAPAAATYILFTPGTGTYNLSSLGGNIIDDASLASVYTNTNDLINTNPQLSAVYTYNGGYTPNYMLLASSAAINNATAGAPVLDQRDYGRSGVADAGAVEFCTAATQPTIGVGSTTICNTQQLKLWVQSGTQNDASNWGWHIGSCGGNNVGNGDTLLTTIGSTTKFYLRGEGGCPPPTNCDSVTITVNRDTILTFTDTICQGDSAFYQGAWQKTSGTYDDTLATALGCDSILRTTLTVNPTYFIQLLDTICDSDSAFYQGAWQNTSGTYYDTLQTVSQCDSVIETTLTVNPTFLTQLTDTICQGDSAFYQGSWQTSGGTYYDTLQTHLGCDSVIETTLTVNPTFFNQLTQDICASDSAFLQNAWQKSAGTYYDTLQTVAGCDSVIETTLTVNPEPFNQVSLDICPSDSAFLENAWRTTAGTYYDTLSTSAGCDSIVETILTLTDTIDPLITCPSDIESCNAVVSFTVPVGTDNCPGDTTTQIDGTGLTSGSTFPEGVTTLQWQVTDFVGNTATCSFNVTVHPEVTINIADMTVPCKQATQVPGTVTGATTISWTPITGLDDPTVASPTANIEETTVYTVIAFNANCSDTDMVTLTVDENVDLIINNMLTPNGDGKNDTWDVNKTALLDGCKVVVFNRWGSVVWSSSGYNNEWDGTNNGMKCPEGTYWYSIKCDDGKYKGQITLVR